MHTYIQGFILKEHCCMCLIFYNTSVWKSTSYWRNRFIQ